MFLSDIPSPPRSGGEGLGEGAVNHYSTLATVVSIALVIYSLASFIYDFVFQCSKDDVMTSYKTGMSLCHEVGGRCSERA